MPKIAIERAHSIPVEKVTDAVRGLLDGFREEHPGLVKSVDWNADGSVGEAKGKGFSAKFFVSATNVQVKVDLSLFAAPLKGRVERDLSSRLDDILRSA